MTIVDVTETMLPQIAEIERQCFSVPWTIPALRSQLSPGHVFLAAAEPAPRGAEIDIAVSSSPPRGEEETIVLGYVGMLHVLDEGYISNVAVAPAYRRRGIADALLDKLAARGRALALAFATLEVRAGNAPAIALYEKHGYKTVGRRKNYYEKPVEDALLMTLELEK